MNLPHDSTKYFNDAHEHLNYRSIQSLSNHKEDVNKMKYQSNFWGMSILTLLLALSLLSLLNMHSSAGNNNHLNNKDD